MGDTEGGVSGEVGIGGGRHVAGLLSGGREQTFGAPIRVPPSPLGVTVTRPASGLSWSRLVIHVITPH
jgi:hypothetical protein